MRLILFLLLGVSGLALSFYSIDKALLLHQLDGTVKGQVILFGLAAALLFAAGVANLFAAWAMSFGRLSAVHGSATSPVLVSASGVRRPASGIRLKKNLDADQSDVPESKQVVLFVSGWKPWSCPASSFLKSSEHTESSS